MKTYFCLAIAFSVGNCGLWIADCELKCNASSSFIAAEDAKKEPPKLDPIIIQDQLAGSDPLDLTSSQPAKIHIVKLLGGKSYRVLMVKKDSKQNLNPFLRIEDGEFKQLAANAHPNGVRFKFDSLKDGDYRFVATTQGGTGEYILKIIPFELLKIQAHEPGKTHDVPAGGLEYESKLDAKDASDTVRKGHHAKVFLVKMLKNKTYTIEMDSTLPLDAYLRFEDGKGKQLAEDDDGGGFPNARIVYQAPEDGVYRIIATTFQGGAQGNFILRVRDE